MRSTISGHAQALCAGLLLAVCPVRAAALEAGAGDMPNRISINVTVPKQAQGVASRGQSMGGSNRPVGSGRTTTAIVVECGQAACAVAFPDGGGTRADLVSLTLAPLAPAQATALTKGSPSPSLLGGALPGGSIVSAAVAKAGAADAGPSVARPAVDDGAMPARRSAPNAIDVTDVLGDGDYMLTLVVERPTGALKDMVRTQVRAARPQRVRIVVGFSVAAGVVKTRHDTVKNAISNIR